MENTSNTCLIYSCTRYRQLQLVSSQFFTIKPQATKKREQYNKDY